VSAAIGAELPPGAALGRAILEVADAVRARTFYEEVLGLVVHDEAGLLLGPAGGAPLLALRERAGARPVPREGRLGLYHLAFLLPDRPALGRFLRHAQGRGVRLGAADHGVSEALYLVDPDGLGLEVYADRPRESWQWEGAELRMGTWALDAPGLLAGAEGGSFEGMPSGSRLGHVHLQVDDLARAERFYGGIIGFQPTVRAYPGALFLAAGGYHHHLGLNTWSAGARPATVGDARLVSFEIELPSPEDVAQVRARLQAAGAPQGALQGDGVDGVVAVDPVGVGVIVRARGEASSRVSP
jgi:catechol 2,3-dioxygenase